MKPLLLFLFPFFTLLASPSSPDTMFNDLLEPMDGGIFRGINFNMSRDVVYDIETARSTVLIYSDKAPEELIITTDMGEVIEDFADVTYSFDEQGIYAISVETYNEKLSEAIAIYSLLIQHYTEKYDEGKIAEDGYIVFEGKDRQSGEYFSIAIKNIDDVEDSYGLYIYFDILD